MRTKNHTKNVNITSLGQMHSRNIKTGGKICLAVVLLKVHKGQYLFIYILREAKEHVKRWN
jgi:hypothetical protein